MAILIFEDVEVLDFTGPYEVFNVTVQLNDPAPFNVYTVAESHAPIKTRGKLSIHPNYSLYAMPPADILIVPGGAGTRPLLNKPQLLNWLKEQAEHTERLLSVCTGALLLGKAGLLEGLPATTHHDNLDDLHRLAPTTTVIETKRYVDNGKVVTAGGVSAGIDMLLYVVQQLLGDEILAKTLAEMEYPWTPDNTVRWKANLNT